MVVGGGGGGGAGGWGAGGKRIGSGRGKIFYLSLVG